MSRRYSTMTNTPRRRINALIAATNRQPIAGLLTVLAYLVAVVVGLGVAYAAIEFAEWLAGVQ
jgi:hypothetical protein